MLFFILQWLSFSFTMQINERNRYREEIIFHEDSEDKNYFYD